MQLYGKKSDLYALLNYGLFIVTITIFLKHTDFTWNVI